MNVPQLEYAGPGTPAGAPPAPLWRKVVVTLVLLGVFGLFVVKLEDVMTDRSRKKVARLAAAKTDVEMLDSALGRFQRDVGRVPSNAEGLNALVGQPEEVDSWLGPYLKRGVPLDPWGNAYVYHAHKPVGSKKYTLLSRGPDGVEGTADDVVNE